MISKIKGQIDHIYNHKLIITTNDIGYEVFCPQILINKSFIGQNITIFIVSQIKDNEIELFGFEDIESKELFMMLKSVNGVGAKMAISFLDLYNQDTIKDIIVSKNHDLLKKVQGVGEKVSKRIILELSAKISKIHSYTQEKIHPNAEDAIIALVKLGVSYNDAKNTVSKINSKTNENISAEEIIKLSLQELQK